ncbi:Toll/interleukin-1 receptor homology (TIR) domain - like 10, partial [Theobroma cacao]
DDDKIERGEKIRDEIERAIYESKISIIIFLKNYTSSTWSLNELVKIMEHRKFSKHIVLTIFYDVNPSQVGIATICGIGGIGKTTIAKVVYNLNIQKFESFSFLDDVRETTQERNGVVRLQRQLISNILKGKANKIHNSNDGITKIKEVIRCRRMLIVLDDVDDSEKITKIFGAQIPFHSGSKIIITNRHRCLLSDLFIRHMFDFEASSSYRDLCKVFENDPIDSYMEYARSVVKHCGGLPLALQVLGSSLSGKSINVWRSAIEKLKAIPDNKIQKILRISYDSLQDDHDKNLFLDITCVFVGKNRDYTTIVLNGCNYYTAVGIENLINRFLLVVNEKNKLMMHQMIRDMGRNITRQESPNLAKRSRDYKDFPKSLIWLSWYGFAQEYLPTNLDISKLVVLEMCNSSLKRVWNDSKCFLPNLKIFNLSHSHGLLKILNLSGLHSLERLMLKHCIKLIEVDQSIGEIKSLIALNLKGCKSLKKLLRTISLLESLE